MQLKEILDRAEGLVASLQQARTCQDEGRLETAKIRAAQALNLAEDLVEKLKLELF